MRVFSPSTEQELADIINSSTAPLALVGEGTKPGFGRPVDADQMVSLAMFSGVKLYEPEELVMEAGAATSLDEIERMLDREHQRLAFEPPNLSRLMRSNSRGTLGSVIACNLSGPRRLTAGAARDHILGVHCVSGRGEIFKAGGRVVKNVTGYDIAKLMTGSFGTLAAMTTITMKVLPKPECEITLIAKVRDVHHAGSLMRQAMQSPYDVCCAAYVPDHGVGLRLEGIKVSVDARKLSLIKHLAVDPVVMDDEKSWQFWRAMRDCDHHMTQEGHCLWRISVAPSEGPRIAEALARDTGGRFTLDWSGGLIWLDVPASDDAFVGQVRSSVGAGYATLVVAPESIRRSVSVFQPQPQSLSGVAARVKHAFDPKGILNPFRMSTDY